MKKLLTTTVAAAALIGVMASDANAFGISINLGSLFGGRYIHRTHHSYGSRRHATRHETRQASRHATRHETRQASRRSNGHKPEEAAKPTQPKDLPLVTVISGNYSTADQVRIKYNSLQKEFKDLIGPVTIFTYGTIGDFRAKTKKYDAPDNATGYSLEYTYDKDHSHAYCAVHLIESAGPEEYADRSLVHELGHCVDFRYSVSHRMSTMEAFFADVTKETKPQIIKDGFGYYTTEPREAFAETFAHYLATPTEDFAKWEADWPNLDAEIRRLFDVEHLAYTKPAAPTVAPSAKLDLG
jgi:hypothetical protein